MLFGKVMVPLLKMSSPSSSFTFYLMPLSYEKKSMMDFPFVSSVSNFLKDISLNFVEN